MAAHNQGEGLVRHGDHQLPAQFVAGVGEILVFQAVTRCGAHIFQAVALTGTVQAGNLHLCQTEPHSPVLGGEGPFVKGQG